MKAGSSGSDGCVESGTVQDEGVNACLRHTDARDDATYFKRTSYVHDTDPPAMASDLLPPGAANEGAVGNPYPGPVP